MSLDINFDADYAKPLAIKWIGHMQRMRQYRRALKDYIHREKIDLCISLGGKEIAFLQALPCRTMAELHFAKDQRQHLLQATHHGAFWRLLGYIRTRQLVRAVKPLERLVVLTEKDKADWEKEGCSNVMVIPNPCCLDMQHVADCTARKKIVLAVGRLHEQKGFDLLLHAWKPIENNYPDWMLRIVGEGPQQDVLEKQIRKLSLHHVVLAGRTDNITKEYSNASLLVLSSRYEGFSLVLLEAMWCGLPCVAFDCPQGPSELLADHRGWLVPSGDIFSLSKQIEYTMTHPGEASKRAQKAQMYAYNTYSESNIMYRWKKLLET
ncbi:MAG: glycosyltransferase [Paludibacteraceae bacterium]|nr:glycosyltransferase [Paludibacteraceae bacterium]